MWVDDPAATSYSLPSPGRVERQDSSGNGQQRRPVARSIATALGSASPATAEPLADSMLSGSAGSRRDGIRPTSSGGSSGGGGGGAGAANGSSSSSEGSGRKGSRLRPRQLLRLG